MMEAWCNLFSRQNKAQSKKSVDHKIRTVLPILILGAQAMCSQCNSVRVLFCIQQKSTPEMLKMNNVIFSDHKSNSRFANHQKNHWTLIPIFLLSYELFITVFLCFQITDPDQL